MYLWVHSFHLDLGPLVNCLSQLSPPVPTSEAGKVAVHVVGVAVPDALLHVRAESDCGGVQTCHVVEQPLGGVAADCANLYIRIKHLWCDYGSWLAGKIAQLLFHLSQQKGMSRCGGEEKQKENTERNSTTLYGEAHSL